jgi:hypothetical protein
MIQQWKRWGMGSYGDDTFIIFALIIKQFARTIYSQPLPI